LIGGNGETCSAGEGLTAILTSGKCLHNIRQWKNCRDIGNDDSSSNGYGGTRSGMYPPGCWIDTDTNLYYYNSYLSSSTTCKSRYQCVCDTKTCQSCPQGYYSAGGTDVLCTKCPSDKRITGNGKSTTTGATSITSCKASPYKKVSTGTSVYDIKILCIDEENKCRLHNTVAKNCPIDWILIARGNICSKIEKYKCCKHYNQVIFDKLNAYYGKNGAGILKNRRKRRNIPSIESMPNIESRLKRRAIMGKGDARMRVC